MDLGGWLVHRGKQVNLQEFRGETIQVGWEVGVVGMRAGPGNQAEGRA